jgi:hypothetical protein
VDVLEDGSAQESNLFELPIMVQQMEGSGQRVLTGRFLFRAIRTEQVGGGNLLAEWAAAVRNFGGGLTGRDDYTITGRVTIELL